MRRRKKHDPVFCHNDLSSNTIIVYPDTLKIKAIIGWEYAGFYPPEFEVPFYRRSGPSIALEGEVDDVKVLMDIISKEREYLKVIVENTQSEERNSVEGLQLALQTR